MSEALVKFGVVAVKTNDERREAMFRAPKSFGIAWFLALLRKLRHRARAIQRRTLRATGGKDTTLPPIG